MPDPALSVRDGALAPWASATLEYWNRVLDSVAEAHGKTPAQVLIRWHLQLGNIVIPKSVNPDRIASNFDVFDFELTAQDIESIATLEDGTRLGPDPRTFNWTG